MSSVVNPLLYQGVEYLQRGQFKEAENTLRALIAQDPRCAEAYQFLGMVFVDRKDFAQANIFFSQAVALDPENPVFNSNLGNSLQDTGRLEESLPYYHKAIQVRPDFADGYFNLSNSLRKLQRYPEALHYIAITKSLNPNYTKCYINASIIYESQKKTDLAITELLTGLKTDPNSYEILVNLAILYSLKKDYPTTMEYFKKAFATGQADERFFTNYGTVCINVNNPAEAVQAFLKAAEINPAKNEALGRALHQKMLLADWSGINELNDQIIRRLSLNQDVVDPFGYMGYSDSEKDLQLAGQIYLREKFPPPPRDFILKKLPRHKKIKIAYVSGEYREHANGSLMTGLIECHDKEKFEVIGLDNGHADESDLRRRLIAAFDRFTDIREIGDLDLVEQLRAQEIDILVNLNGFFGAHRTGLFSHRSAPIQINFLGCPGTMGQPYMDYLVADPVVVPPTSYQYYDEKILSLPHSYQINDSKRPALKRNISRKDCDLPEDAFVFCCFNNIYKVTPWTFKRWMRILERVPQSVLWFYASFPDAGVNLKREAQALGINPDRLIFAKYINMYEHLERNALADLFLDSLPYNAHTSASDALWANLPVLTLEGKSFAGRVASSLLQAIKLPELITYTEEEFENKAIELATHPEKLAAIRDKLSQNRLTTPLFDTQRYTRHFESALTAIYERYQADLPPDHIQVQP